MKRVLRQTGEKNSPLERELILDTTYAVERSKHCSSVIYRRLIPFPTPVSPFQPAPIYRGEQAGRTPDELGNYSKSICL